MVIEHLQNKMGWKIEPQTSDEYRIALSMIEALELKTIDDKQAGGDSQATE